MKDVMGMMKQLGAMQQKMQQAQEDLGNLEVEGQAGAGLVKLKLTGKGDVRGVSIDPSLMQPGENEILEDLIVAAFQDAKGKSDRAVQDKMAEVTGGLPLPPGMKLF